MGTSIHVKDNIAVSKHKSFSNSYCEANLVQIKELNCNLICFYRPPNTKSYAFAEALETINEWIENDKEDLVIVGDFNFKEMSCWEEKEIKRLREKATKKEVGNRGSLLTQELGLLAFIEEHYLNQLVKGETRNKQQPLEKRRNHRECKFIRPQYN